MEIFDSPSVNLFMFPIISQKGNARRRVNEISKFISDNDINWDIKELTIDKDGAKILKGE